MRAEQELIRLTVEAIKNIFSLDIEPGQVQLEKTNKEFEGDYTIVVFPMVKLIRKNPAEIAESIGNFILAHSNLVEKFNVIKGFLNFTIHSDYWLQFFSQCLSEPDFGFQQPDSSQPYIIEFSSPNTNKPLHLGHIRNNLLGFSISRILKASGKKVITLNLVNDRGIHICKSMLAWQKWGNGETPGSSGIKGDHLVGKYYVLFNKHYTAEIRHLVETGMDEETAKNAAPLLLEAQEMLRKWENHDEEVIQTWKLLNSWVYQGFDVTYKRLGIGFDKTEYESQTYLTGKEIVTEGLEKGFLQKKDDGSVWADLSAGGYDQKLLLRSDGTSVYITQDLGTAWSRHYEFSPAKMIYVVGNEQIYHFDILKLILKKLGHHWAEMIFHLSYGMVELPHGRMKSREGTVVDADDLMDEMILTAGKTSEALGKVQDFEEEELNELYRILGLGALKYFILKVDPKKNMLFNPEESIDFNGNTGPFIQYTHARIRSVLRKGNANYETMCSAFTPGKYDPSAKEKKIISLLYDFPEIVINAAESLSPALVANFAYELAKEFNQYYQETSILKAGNENATEFRLLLAGTTASVIKKAMYLLGIEVPEKM